MSQALQLVGAVLVLAAFALLQLGRLGERSRLFLLLNIAGALLLAAIALVERQWGFLLLEGAWVLVSAWGLTPWARTA